MKFGMATVAVKVASLMAVVATVAAAAVQQPALQPPLGLRGSPQAEGTSQSAASHAGMPSGDAITLAKWAGLKAAIDQVASQVKQVLLVRTDMAMMQEDLDTQEQVWHKAQADLEKEIAQLGAQVGLLQQQVGDGAHIYDDVKHLRGNITEQQDLTARAKALYEHDREKAKLEKERLSDRFDQLREHQAEANETGVVAIQRARDGELRATEELSRLERAAGEAKYRLVDEQSALKREQAEAIAREKELTSQLANLNMTVLHMEQQVIPKSQQASQLQTLQARLQQETAAIVQVETEAVQIEAQCKVKVETVQNALVDEQAKANSRHAEMVPVCNAATEKHIILQQLLMNACGTSSDVAPAPAAAMAPAPALGSG